MFYNTLKIKKNLKHFFSVYKINNDKMNDSYTIYFNPSSIMQASLSMKNYPKETYFVIHRAF